MTGAAGREIYQVAAPATTMNRELTPGNICMPPMTVPTLLVRQTENNAEKHPFVGVYEAYKAGAAEVQQVSALPGNGNCVGVKVQTLAGGTDYLFSATDKLAYTPAAETSFCGNFGLTREKDGKITGMYLGNGQLLKKRTYSLEAEDNVYATVYLHNGKWYYSSTGTVKIKTGEIVKTLQEGYNQRL